MNIKNRQPGQNSAVLTHECSTFSPITHRQTASYPATAWGNKMYLFTTATMKTTTMAMMKTLVWRWRRVGNVLLGCYCYGGGSDKAEELPMRMTIWRRSAGRDTIICGMGGVGRGVERGGFAVCHSLLPYNNIMMSKSKQHWCHVVVAGACLLLEI